MAYINSQIARALFNDLNESINDLYSKNNNIDMMSVLRNSSKLKYFLDSDFERLWYMEQEDNDRLKALLKAAEEEVLYADMPPLVEPDLETNQPSVINPEEDDEMPPLIDENNIIWPSYIRG